MLNVFEGVIAIHGDEDAEKKLRFSSELVGASRTGMMKPPAWIVVLESNLDQLIHTEENGKVDIKANRELVAEIWAEGNTMEIAEHLYKWIDCEMGAAEAGNAVKLKDTYSNGKSHKMWSTRNDSFMYKGGRHTEVTFAQSNLPPAWSLKVRDLNQQEDADEVWDDRNQLTIYI